MANAARWAFESNSSLFVDLAAAGSRSKTCPATSSRHTTLHTSPHLRNRTGFRVSFFHNYITEKRNKVVRVDYVRGEKSVVFFFCFVKYYFTPSLSIFFLSGFNRIILLVYKQVRLKVQILYRSPKIRIIGFCQFLDDYLGTMCIVKCVLIIFHFLDLFFFFLSFYYCSRNTKFESILSGVPSRN